MLRDDIRLFPVQEQLLCHRDPVMIEQLDEIHSVMSADDPVGLPDTEVQALCKHFDGAGAEADRHKVLDQLFADIRRVGSVEGEVKFIRRQIVAGPAKDRTEALQDKQDQLVLDEDTGEGIP